MNDFVTRGITDAGHVTTLLILLAALAFAPSALGDLAPDPPPQAHEKKVTVDWTYIIASPTNKPGFIAFCIVPAKHPTRCIFGERGRRH